MVRERKDEKEKGRGREKRKERETRERDKRERERQEREKEREREGEKRKRERVLYLHANMCIHRCVCGMHAQRWRVHMFEYAVGSCLVHAHVRGSTQTSAWPWNIPGTYVGNEAHARQCATNIKMSLLAAVSYSCIHAYIHTYILKCMCMLIRHLFVVS